MVKSRAQRNDGKMRVSFPQSLGGNPGTLSLDTRFRVYGVRLIWIISSFVIFIPISIYAVDDNLLASIDNLEARLNEREATLLYLETELTDRTQRNDSAASYEEIVAYKDSILKDANLTPRKKAELLINLTRALINLGSREEAFKVCEDFSRQCPESKQEASGLFCLVGSYSQEMEKYPLAIQAYERAKEVVLNDTKGAFLAPAVYIDLGFCYYKEGKYENALKEYKLAIGKESALDVNSLQWTLLQIGRCNFFLKDYNQAKSSFLKAVNVAKDTDLAQQAKANIEDMEKIGAKP